MLIFLISVQTSFKNVASSSFFPTKEAACLRIHSKNKNLLNKWTLLFLLPIIIIVHFKKLTIELGRMDERDFRNATMWNPTRAWERNFWATLPAGRPLGPFLNSARINRRRPISRWLLCSPVRRLRSVLSGAQGGNLLLANTGRSTSPQAAGAVWKLVRCWSSESDSCRQNGGINNVEKI